MPRTLFVDYDGTLHDSDSVYDARLDGVLGMKGIEFWQAYISLHREVVHSRYPERHDDFEFHLRLLFERWGRPPSEEQTRAIARRFQEAQEECWKAPLFFPDSLLFLDAAKEWGYCLCLATGDYAAEKARALEEAGGKKYFDYAFDRTHLGLKGESAYFEQALVITATRPEEAVAIGDSLSHDIEAAKAAGMATIWVNRQGMARGSVQPDFEVENLLDALMCI